MCSLQLVIPQWRRLQVVKFQLLLEVEWLVVILVCRPEMLAQGQAAMFLSAVGWVEKVDTYWLQVRLRILATRVVQSPLAVAVLPERLVLAQCPWLQVQLSLELVVRSPLVLVLVRVARVEVPCWLPVAAATLVQVARRCFRLAVLMLAAADLSTFVLV
jgi:hypothetical protein